MNAHDYLNYIESDRDRLKSENLNLRTTLAYMTARVEHLEKELELTKKVNVILSRVV